MYRVFAAEDDPDFLGNIDFVLKGTGHRLVLTATTLGTALEAIRTFPQLGITVASIDGNLMENVRTGADGRQMVEEIRELAPEVKIIGMSGEPMANVDVDLGKKRIEELGQIITEL